MSQSACIDDRALARLRRQGGPVLVREIVKIFLEDAPILVREARAAALAKNLDAVRRAAHSLKSMAGALGAVELRDASERIEMLAEENAGPAVDALMDQWGSTYAAAEQQLTAVIAADFV